MLEQLLIGFTYNFFFSLYFATDFEPSTLLTDRTTSLELSLFCRLQHGLVKARFKQMLRVVGMEDATC